MAKLSSKASSGPSAIAQIKGMSKPKRKRIQRNTADLERGSKDSYCVPRKPAPVARVLDERGEIPKRCKKTGRLLFKDHPEFRPNLTPKQVLQLGSFGGTYFRPIKSAVTGIKYKSSEVLKEFPKSWFEGLEMKYQVTSSTYRPSMNKYKKKCGGDLDMWESSGWISAIDPYGWFQWYCRFYLGRRSTDDERQIKRGNGVMGPKGRFRNQLIGRCSRGNTTYNDYKISPVIRQALQHWGYQLTQKDADAYCKKKGLSLCKRPPAKKK
eukprot:g2591.t1